MHACVTDYEALYNDAYRARRGEHTSFDRSVLPSLVAEKSLGLGCKKHLDVSGGQGNLGRDLAELGITTTTTDIGALPGSPVLPFNLAVSDDSATRRVLNEIHATDDSYLTSCFDVLEHIDREHVAAAVHNLATLADQHLIVSISTRPSAYDNLLHATLLPIAAWIACFRLAGFEVKTIDVFPEAQHKPDFPDVEDLQLVHHWMNTDVFEDVEFGEPRYVHFEKVTSAPDLSLLKRDIDAVVDVGYRIEKRKAFEPASAQDFVFALHFSQEWSLIRPFLDVLPRDRVHVLIKRGGLQPLHHRAIISFLTRCNVKTTVFDQVPDLDFAEIAGRTLILGAESTATAAHLSGFELSATARLHGCRTVLLQHGVWPRPFDDQIISFASETLFTWSAEEQRRLNKHHHEVFGGQFPWGHISDAQNQPIGSPKFADQLLYPPSHLEWKLGVDRNRFDKAVLLCSKNLRGRWGIHESQETSLAGYEKVIASNPDTFFLVKPHPVDGVDPFLVLRHFPNVRLFDEIIGTLSDSPLNRLLPAIDLVATGPSSVVVDAAVSAKPVFVFDTGQPVELEHMKAQPIDALGRTLHDAAALQTLSDRSSALKDLYARNSDQDFYAKAAEFLSQPAGINDPGDLAKAATLSSTANRALRDGTALRAEIVELQLALEKAEARVTDLEKTGADTHQHTDPRPPFLARKKRQIMRQFNKLSGARAGTKP
ncbi:hypothetical protein [uncultured Shimia sp.]|uniref:hypothetical protein n=1 Tax=uncultured Shimia sp. TaxID=573152 RepID=UPI0026176609|nr:hypothetical protein [uncultured Shimia sp.]